MANVCQIFGKYFIISLRVFIWVGRRYEGHFRQIHNLPCKTPKVRQQGIAGSAAPALRKVDFQGREGEFFPRKNLEGFFVMGKKGAEKSALNYQKYVDFFLSFCGLEGSSFLGRCRGLVGGT